MPEQPALKQIPILLSLRADFLREGYLFSTKFNIEKMPRDNVNNFRQLKKIALE